MARKTVLKKEVLEVTGNDAAATVFVALGVGVLVALSLIVAIAFCSVFSTAEQEVAAAVSPVQLQGPRSFVFLPPGSWTYPDSDQCAYDADDSQRVLLIAGETCRRWAMEHPYHCSVDLEQRYTQYADDLFVSATSDGPRIFYVDDVAAPQAVVARVSCD
jgi:hypothetical protein